MEEGTIPIEIVHTKKKVCNAGKLKKSFLLGTERIQFDSEFCQNQSKKKDV